MMMDNAAMDLEHKEQTYPCSPELMGNTSQQEESTGRGGNYINATMSQRYLNSNIADHLQAANYPLRLISNVRLVKYCLQLAHIERCYSAESHNKQKERCLALQLYLILIKREVTPTEG